LSDALVGELGMLEPGDSIAGYRARFIYMIHGRRLRSTLYPPRTVLYRTEGAVYRQEGHGHRVAVPGKVQQLTGIIYHDDRKPLARWIDAQRRYANEEAEYLLSGDRASLSRVDRLRLMGWPAPLGILFYTLFAKGCLLDGWRGWYYGLQRLVAEALIALEINERRLRDRNADPR
jgi:hypothetical protein